MADPAQDLPNYSQFDERAAYTYEAIALSKAMVSRTPGIGQAYLGSYRDKEGHAFDGAKSYRLRVPPNPPAKQFWSVTSTMLTPAASSRTRNRSLTAVRANPTW